METTFNIEYDSENERPFPPSKCKIISPTMNEKDISEFLGVILRNKKNKLLRITSDKKSVDSEVTLRILRKSGFISI
jgi:hypothetical protein